MDNHHHSRSRGTFRPRNRGQNRLRALKRRPNPNYRPSPRYSPYRRDRSESRERRSFTSSPSPCRELVVDDDRDRQIFDLKRQLKDSDDMINGYRTIISNLEQYIRQCEQSKRESDQKYEQIFKESDTTSPTNLRLHANLKMQVQTQSILIRQLKEENDYIKSYAGSFRRDDHDQHRLETMQGPLRNVAYGTVKIKYDWRILKNEIGQQLKKYNEEFVETRDQINAILETGFINRAVTGSSMDTKGKIVVEERHLKELLRTVLFHTEAVAQDCFKAATKYYQGTGEKSVNGE